MKKTLLFTAMALACTCALAQTKTVTLTTAGTLSAQISDSEKYTITALTVSGPVNGEDIALMRDMAGIDEEGEASEGKLQQIDLSGASIVAGGIYMTDMKSATDYEAEANTVGYKMFSGLNLTSVQLPAGIVKLGDQAFAKCGQLATVGGVENATTLGTSVFESCEKLSGVKLNAGLTTIPAALFKRCYALTSFTIPAGVTTIGEEAFYGSALNSLTLPEGLTTIGKSAFESTAISTLTLPSTVKELGANAFNDCDALTEAKLNEGLETIGNDCFGWSAELQKVNIPSTVKNMGESVFARCKKLAEVTLPEGLTELPQYTFDQCSALTAIAIPSTVKAIGECAFQMCDGLQQVTLAEGLEEIGEGAFRDCSSLTAIDLPTTLTTIGNEAFSGCDLSEVTIPEGIKQLGVSGGGVFAMPGGMVFMWNMNLKKVELPSTITNLGWQTFSGCPLEQIIIHATTPPSISGRTENPFDMEVFETCTVYVPAEALDAYKADEGWSQFFSTQPIVTTAISSTAALRQADSTVYSLSGLRRDGLRKGINIVGGKKVMK